MNLKRKFLYFITLLVCISACSKNEQKVVDLGDGEKVIEIKSDEVRLDDLVEEKKEKNTQESTQTAPQRLSDNSEITVMLDGFGNKLERRYFKNHPRLDSVMVRTAANGRLEVIIYTTSGKRLSVGGEIVGKLLTASADEIANAAKIYETPRINQSQTTYAENKSSEMKITVLPPIRLSSTPAEETSQEQSRQSPQTAEPQTKPVSETESDGKIRVAKKGEEN